MNVLKQELQKKRQAVTDDFGGRSFVRRSELEQKRLQKLLAKASVPAPSTDPAAASTSGPRNPDSALGDPNPSSEDPRVDEIHLPRHEVVRRLRVFHQPVTLFGEEDAARIERLKFVLKSGVVRDIHELDMAQGQTNDFLRDMIEMRKRHKAGRDACANGKGNSVSVCGVDGDSADDGDGGMSADNADKDSERMTAKFDELCKEDKILVFFKRLLSQWKQELENMTELEKRTADWKMKVGRFNQCARYLEPLFKLCRKKVVPDDICQALLGIVECCMKHDYLMAMKQYIELTIGNGPWPMGVTMVGIHERSAREKIHTNSVAHIMNDETTRRYLHSIKRLVTFASLGNPENQWS